MAKRDDGARSSIISIKTLTVSVVWGADQVGLLAQRELGNTLVPALDDASDTNLGDKRRSTVTGRVELGSVLESSDVWD